MIPGIAVAVMRGDSMIDEWYSGYADVENAIPVSEQTVFPIASVTKTVCTYLAMDLIDKGILDLEMPIATYLPDYDIPSGILLKHLLSHTSEGIPGSYYNYSSRIGLLGPIIEAATVTPLEEHIEKLIVDLKLKNTILMRSEDDMRDREMAQPYTAYGVVEKANYEYGFSYSAGIASTARDMMVIDSAVGACSILNCSARDLMYAPFELNSGQLSPYGLGCFSQRFIDVDAVWSYGQYDAFSSLYLKFPESDLTFVLLANNNFMSDPPRLIYGNLEYSLFALACYNHFISDGSASANKYLESAVSESNTALEKRYILANFLASGFMGQGVVAERERCHDILDQVIANADKFKDEMDLTFVHGVMSVLETEDASSSEIVLLDALCEELDKSYSYNPYLVYYEAMLSARQGNDADALVSYLSLVEGENKVVWWYSIEAWRWLGDYYVGNDSLDQASEYYQKVVDNGWNIDGAVDYARQQLKNMNRD